MVNKLNDLEQKIKKKIISVPNFPIKGIIFRDITPILLTPSLFKLCIDQMADFVSETKATAIIAPELRGCLFAAPIAYKLGLSLVVARKKGKLPRQVYTVEYQCEYRVNHLQIHCDSLKSTDKVVVLDDVLATSGTAIATSNLVHQTGAKVIGYGFLIELFPLGGRAKLEDNVPVFSIVRY